MKRQVLSPLGDSEFISTDSVEINNKIKYFDINTTGNDYVVGDIHGNFEELKQRLQEVNFNEDTDRLFAVGDLVDRGPDSELVLTWLKKPWFHSVRGNHEDMLIKDLIHPQNGSLWWATIMDHEREEIRAHFEVLPFIIEVKTKTGKIGIIHADSGNDWESFKKQIMSDNLDPLTHKAVFMTALWSRDRLYYSSTEPVIGIDKLYVGHNVVTDVKCKHNVIFIDTGSGYSDGKLTIIKIN